jgi:hypothetical protein
MEEYDGSPKERNDKFHQEEIRHNETQNWIAISKFEALAGRKPESKAEVALAREFIAYSGLEGDLAREHVLYLEGVYSGEHTPVFMIRKIQKLCEQKISLLRNQVIGSRASTSAAQATWPVVAESGYLVFKAESAYFRVQAGAERGAAGSNSLRTYDVYNACGARVGDVLSNDDAQAPPPRAEFVVICKQHPHPRLAITTEATGRAQFGDAWTLMKEMKYAVLMIERRNGTAYRIGQGTIAVSFWDQEGPLEKLIVLG